MMLESKGLIDDLDNAFTFYQFLLVIFLTGNDNSVNHLKRFLSQFHLRIRFFLEQRSTSAFQKKREPQKYILICKYICASSIKGEIITGREFLPGVIKRSLPITTLSTA